VYIKGGAEIDPYNLQSSKWKVEFTDQNQILEFILYKHLNKNWKIYWSEQGFTSLVLETWFADGELELLNGNQEDRRTEKFMAPTPSGSLQIKINVQIKDL
jgi:hypothetical protein